ncbi:type II toxin-antitoxin system PemK/MazF family toxin, partial [Burkholderia cenocepacia]
MNRGSIVTVALQGDFGKARPALVVQSDLFAEHPSVTLLLMSSAMVDAPLIRITVVPSEQNGLRMP